MDTNCAVCRACCQSRGWLWLNAAETESEWEAHINPLSSSMMASDRPIWDPVASSNLSPPATNTTWLKRWTTTVHSRIIPLVASTETLNSDLEMQLVYTLFVRPSVTHLSVQPSNPPFLSPPRLHKFTQDSRMRRSHTTLCVCVCVCVWEPVFACPLCMCGFVCVTHTHTHTHTKQTHKHMHNL